MRYPLGFPGHRTRWVPMATFAAASRQALRDLRRCLLGACVACGVGSSGPALAQAPADEEPTEEEVLEQIESGTASVEEVARQLSNPVSSVWNLVVQNNFSLNKGDISNAHRTVPIGLGVAKTFLIGKMPFQVGFEASYAVVHPDTFGQRWNFRLQFKPVVPALIQKPLFGR